MPQLSGELTQGSVQTVFADYTRREHLAELQAHLGWRLFSGRAYRELGAWLIAPARSIDRGVALVEILMEELRRRNVLAPRITVLERLARETRRRARAELLLSKNSAEPEFGMMRGWA